MHSFLYTHPSSSSPFQIHHSPFVQAATLLQHLYDVFAVSHSHPLREKSKNGMSFFFNSWAKWAKKLIHWANFLYISEKLNSPMDFFCLCTEPCIAYLALRIQTFRRNGEHCMGCLCTEPAKELGLRLRFESEKVVWERIKK